jgi:hypothetical protein
MNGQSSERTDCVTTMAAITSKLVMRLRFPSPRSTASPQVNRPAIT